MKKNKKTEAFKGESSIGLGGFLGGLGTLLEKLGELAEKGKELRESGTIQDPKGKVKAVYGFTIRTGLGGDDSLFKVEPFGNVSQDEQTGKPVVHEVLEPMVDVFEESGYVLVVAEMPGVGEEDVHLELREDILTITAGKGNKKYRKEVLLPGTFSTKEMSHTCRNGVLEVKLGK